MEFHIGIIHVGALRRFGFLYMFSFEGFQVTAMTATPAKKTAEETKATTNAATTSRFIKTGMLPGLSAPTPAQQHKIQTVAGTIAGMIRDSRCSDMEAKAVISNLILEFGTLEALSQDQQQAMKANYKQKRVPRNPGWRVR